MILKVCTSVVHLYICTCILGVTAITNHLSRHHNDIWEAYVLARDAKKTAQANIKKEEVLNCEMENAELRFTDMRSNAGQLAFLNQVLFIAWFKVTFAPSSLHF